MKHVRLYVPVSLCVLFLTISCQTDQANDKTTEDTDKEDRNMGGIGLPRGLIINSVNTAPGFVLFG